MSSSTSSAYSFKPGGSLKLKGGAGEKKDRKKKSESRTFRHMGLEASSAASEARSRDSNRAHHVRDAGSQEPPPNALSSASRSKTHTMTESERKFEEARRKRMQERIRKEARTTHKEKVDAFNKYLASASDHNDIPKVGPG